MRSLVAPVLILLTVALGCSSVNHTSENSKQQLQQLKGATTPHVLVQSEPKGKTGVYQQDLRFFPQLTVNGEAIAPGEHAFDLASMASYSGKKPTCDVKSLVLSISHSTSRDQSWRFPPNSTASVIVDGSPLELKVYSQIPYGLPEMAKYMKNPEAGEGLIISPTCEVYQRISQAKTMEFRIGNASFTLQPAGVASFREFAQAIGFK